MRFASPSFVASLLIVFSSAATLCFAQKAFTTYAFTELNTIPVSRVPVNGDNHGFYSDAAQAMITPAIPVGVSAASLTMVSGTNLWTIGLINCQELFPAPTNDAVFVCIQRSPAILQLYSSLTGKLIWSSTNYTTLFPFVRFSGAQSNILAAWTDQRLIAFNIDVGGVVWTYSLASYMNIQPLALNEVSGLSYNAKSNIIVSCFVYGVGLMGHDAATGKLMWVNDYGGDFIYTALSCMTTVTMQSQVSTHIASVPVQNSDNVFFVINGKLRWIKTSTGNLVMTTVVSPNDPSVILGSQAYGGSEWVYVQSPYNNQCMLYMLNGSTSWSLVTGQAISAYFTTAFAFGPYLWLGGAGSVMDLRNGTIGQPLPQNAYYSTSYTLTNPTAAKIALDTAVSTAEDLFMNGNAAVIFTTYNLVTYYTNFPSNPVLMWSFVMDDSYVAAIEVLPGSPLLPSTVGYSTSLNVATYCVVGSAWSSLRVVPLIPSTALAATYMTLTAPSSSLAYVITNGNAPNGGMMNLMDLSNTATLWSASFPVAVPTLPTVAVLPSYVVVAGNAPTVMSFALASGAVSSATVERSCGIPANPSVPNLVGDSTNGANVAWFTAGTGCLYMYRPDWGNITAIAVGYIIPSQFNQATTVTPVVSMDAVILPLSYSLQVVVKVDRTTRFPTGNVYLLAVPVANSTDGGISSQSIFAYGDRLFFLFVLDPGPPSLVAYDFSSNVGPTNNATAFAQDPIWMAMSLFYPPNNVGSANSWKIFTVNDTMIATSSVMIFVAALSDTFTGPTRLLASMDLLGYSSEAEFDPNTGLLFLPGEQSETTYMFQIRTTGTTATITTLWSSNQIATTGTGYPAITTGPASSRLGLATYPGANNVATMCIFDGNSGIVAGVIDDLPPTAWNNDNYLRPLWVSTPTPIAILPATVLVNGELQNGAQLLRFPSAASRIQTNPLGAGPQGTLPPNVPNVQPGQFIPPTPAPTSPGQLPPLVQQPGEPTAFYKVSLSSSAPLQTVLLTDQNGATAAFIYFGPGYSVVNVANGAIYTSVIATNACLAYAASSTSFYCVTPVGITWVQVMTAQPISTSISARSLQWNGTIGCAVYFKTAGMICACQNGTLVCVSGSNQNSPVVTLPVFRAASTMSLQAVTEDGLMAILSTPTGYAAVSFIDGRLTLVWSMQTWGASATVVVDSNLLLAYAYTPFPFNGHYNITVLNAATGAIKTIIDCGPSEAPSAVTVVGVGIIVIGNVSRSSVGNYGLTAVQIGANSVTQIGRIKGATSALVYPATCGSSPGVVAIIGNTTTWLACLALPTLSMVWTIPNFQHVNDPLAAFVLPSGKAVLVGGSFVDTVGGDIMWTSQSYSNGQGAQVRLAATVTAIPASAAGTADDIVFITQTTLSPTVSYEATAIPQSRLYQQIQYSAQQKLYCVNQRASDGSTVTVGAAGIVAVLDGTSFQIRWQNYVLPNPNNIISGYVSSTTTVYPVWGLVNSRTALAFVNSGAFALVNLANGYINQTYSLETLCPGAGTSSPNRYSVTTTDRTGDDLFIFASGNCVFRYSSHTKILSSQYFNEFVSVELRPVAEVSTNQLFVGFVSGSVRTLNLTSLATLNILQLTGDAGAVYRLVADGTALYALLNSQLVVIDSIHNTVGYVLQTAQSNSYNVQDIAIGLGCALLVSGASVQCYDKRYVNQSVLLWTWTAPGSDVVQDFLVSEPLGVIFVLATTRLFAVYLEFGPSVQWYQMNPAPNGYQQSCFQLRGPVNALLLVGCSTGVFAVNAFSGGTVYVPFMESLDDSTIVSVGTSNDVAATANYYSYQAPNNIRSWLTMLHVPQVLTQSTPPPFASFPPSTGTVPPGATSAPVSPQAAHFTPVVSGQQQALASLYTYNFLHSAQCAIPGQGRLVVASIDGSTVIVINLDTGKTVNRFDTHVNCTQPIRKIFVDTQCNYAFVLLCQSTIALLNLQQVNAKIVWGRDENYFMSIPSIVCVLVNPPTLAFVNNNNQIMGASVNALGVVAGFQVSNFAPGVQYMWQSPGVNALNTFGSQGLVCYNYVGANQPVMWYSMQYTSSQLTNIQLVNSVVVGIAGANFVAITVVQSGPRIVTPYLNGVTQQNAGFTISSAASLNVIGTTDFIIWQASSGYVAVMISNAEGYYYMKWNTQVTTNFYVSEATLAGQLLVLAGGTNWMALSRSSGQVVSNQLPQAAHQVYQMRPLRACDGTALPSDQSAPGVLVAAVHDSGVDFYNFSVSGAQAGAFPLLASYTTTSAIATSVAFFCLANPSAPMLVSLPAGVVFSATDYNIAQAVVPSSDSSVTTVNVMMASSLTYSPIFQGFGPTVQYSLGNGTTIEVATVINQGSIFAIDDSATIRWTGLTLGDQTLQQYSAATPWTLVVFGSSSQFSREDNGANNNMIFMFDLPTAGRQTAELAAAATFTDSCAVPSTTGPPTTFYASPAANPAPDFFASTPTDPVFFFTASSPCVYRAAYDSFARVIMVVGIAPTSEFINYEYSATPLLAASTVVVMGPSTALLGLSRDTTMRIVWRAQLGFSTIASTPVIARTSTHDYVFVGNSFAVYCVNALNGGMAWTRIPAQPAAFHTAHPLVVYPIQGLAVYPYGSVITAIAFSSCPNAVTSSNPGLPYAWTVSLTSFSQDTTVGLQHTPTMTDAGLFVMMYVSNGAPWYALFNVSTGAQFWNSTLAAGFTASLVTLVAGKVLIFTSNSPSTSVYVSAANGNVISTVSAMPGYDSNNIGFTSTAVFVASATYPYQSTAIQALKVPSVIPPANPTTAAPLPVLTPAVPNSLVTTAAPSTVAPTTTKAPPTTTTKAPATQPMAPTSTSTPTTTPTPPPTPSPTTSTATSTTVTATATTTTTTPPPTTTTATSTPTVTPMATTSKPPSPTQTAAPTGAPTTPATTTDTPPTTPRPTPVTTKAPTTTVSPAPTSTTAAPSPTPYAAAPAPPAGVTTGVAVGVAIAAAAVTGVVTGALVYIIFRRRRVTTFVDEDMINAVSARSLLAADSERRRETRSAEITN